MPDGPGGFAQDCTCPALLRVTLCDGRLRIRGCHPLRRRFPAASPRRPYCNLAALQPRGGRNPRGLGSSPVARHYWGNHCYFLFLRVLRCFSSPGSPPQSWGCRAVSAAGCPIRKSAGRRPLAPYRGLSQLITSFIACESQGIRRVPLPTFAFAGRGAFRGRRVSYSLFVLYVYRRCGASLTLRGDKLKILARYYYSITVARVQYVNEREGVRKKGPQRRREKRTGRPGRNPAGGGKGMRTVPPGGEAPDRDASPERRCSSRTFRYGYLVTT